MANENVVVRMELERETKGTFVYKAAKEDAVITTLYINKAAYPDTAPPQKISVTVKDRD